MPSNKDRLYIALYVRGGQPKMPGKEDTYHWALVVGPKLESENEKGMRFHAKEMLNKDGRTEWVFEERITSLAQTNMLLVRVMIAKIEKSDRLLEVLRKTPIRQGQPGWNCVGWVKEALEGLKADGKALGTSIVEWNKVRDAAMDYCQRKRDQHRFDGGAQFDVGTVPTYDLIEQKETVP